MRAVIVVALFAGAASASLEAQTQAQLIETLSSVQLAGNSKEQGMAAGYKMYVEHMLNKMQLSQPPYTAETKNHLQTVIDKLNDILGLLTGDKDAMQIEINNFFDNEWESCVNNTAHTHSNLLLAQVNAAKGEHESCRVNENSDRSTSNTFCDIVHGHLGSWAAANYDCTDAAAYTPTLGLHNGKVEFWWNPDGTFTHADGVTTITQWSEVHNHLDTFFSNWATKFSDASTQWADIQACVDETITYKNTITVCQSKYSTWVQELCHLDHYRTDLCSTQDTCHQAVTDEWVLDYSPGEFPNSTENPTSKKYLSDKRTVEAGMIDYVICVVTAMKDATVQWDANTIKQSCPISANSAYANTFANPPTAPVCEDVRALGNYVLPEDGRDCTKTGNVVSCVHTGFPATAFPHSSPFFDQFLDPLVNNGEHLYYTEIGTCL